MSAAQQMPARRRRRLLLAAAWTLALAALAVLLVFGLAGRGAGTSRPAPALPKQALVGRPPTLAELLGAPHARHAALVVFWASWCEPCQQEAPAVERFARSVAGRGRIAGVDYAESEAAAPRAFVRRYSWTFPTLRDTDGQAGEAYDLGHLPSTYAIDARGRIVDVLVGPQTAGSLTRALATAQGS
jgi:cytochrome c biogenesis protein CcmG/thiol:disulfide interchange protein DsbE